MSPKNHVRSASPTRAAVARCTALLVVTLAAPGARGAGGPDVTVLDLNETAGYGAVGGIRAYAFGTDSCNVGTEPVDWCNEAAGCGGGTTSADHPVVSQNLFRLKGGRFEQIGMAWLKHGFLSQNAEEPACGACVEPPLHGDQLGVGCTDVYDAFLNGNRPLGMRSEANGATGAIVYPYTNVVPADLTEQRVRVPEVDVAPESNPGALFFVEAHYVGKDDAAAGNAGNNASYRRLTVGAAPNYDLALADATVRERAVIYAWRAADPAVEVAVVDLPGAPLERFLVARRVSGSGPTWHYEYAIQNYSSARSARRFAVAFPGGAAISNAGFGDIDHHSGEIYSTTDWTIDTAVAGTVAWSTATHAADPNANALRWSTLFSFWFDAAAAPEAASHTLGLFAPGSPDELAFAFDALLWDNFESGDFVFWNGTSPP
jgi:hypothetical protein